jgi:hypothetical protein
LIFFFFNQEVFFERIKSLILHKLVFNQICFDKNITDYLVDLLLSPACNSLNFVKFENINSLKGDYLNKIIGVCEARHIRLSALDLTNIPLNRENLDKIAAYITKIKSLVLFQLVNNRVEGFDCLGEAIAQNHELITFDMSSNSFVGTNIENFLTGFVKLQKLEQLILSNCSGFEDLIKHQINIWIRANIRSIEIVDFTEQRTKNYSRMLLFDSYLSDISEGSRNASYEKINFEGCFENYELQNLENEVLDRVQYDDANKELQSLDGNEAEDEHEIEDANDESFTSSIPAGIEPKGIYSSIDKQITESHTSASNKENENNDKYDGKTMVNSFSSGLSGQEADVELFVNSKNNLADDYKYFTEEDLIEYFKVLKKLNLRMLVNLFF